ncbi:MAG TPA: alpha/beta hydrolase fold domain-containing protein [Acetobacteraceae bacterium]|nr:alpha/beta hydrolase fold domain-containing protein [Acetobacteraceae bacterium]
MTHAPHPEMEVILAEMRAAAVPDPQTIPLAQARAAFIANAAAWNRPLPSLATHETVLGGIPCRMLTPPDAATDDLIVFIHGGGWTFGTMDTHDRFARLLALATGRAMLVPDYRLAPEHPCPAAIDDILAILSAISARRVVLSGDSAGANIALAAALARPDAAIAGLSLFYGCFGPIFDTGSHRAAGDGRFGLSTTRMRWYWQNWLGPRQDARAAPLHADLHGLPPVHLLAAGLDPLRDDSLLLADRLAAAGVPTRLDLIPGVIHGFLQMTDRLAPARAALGLIADQIRAVFQETRNRENHP